MSDIEKFPRVVRIEELVPDDAIAYVKPAALIRDSYVHPLPEDECERFGVEFKWLLERKGADALLTIGDTFRTFNPHLPGKVEIIGEYLPDISEL